MGKYSALNITGALAAVLWAQGAAQAADLILYSSDPVAEGQYDLTLPAVSDINGKIELYGGLTNPGTAGFRAAGSLSIPVGHSFGVQLDGGVVATGAGAIFGGAVHAFYRDPTSYLVGITGAVARGPSGTIGVIGVEGEVYLDRLSFEAWAGVGGLNYDDPLLADLTGVFIFADAGYYVTDDFRVTAGVAHLLGENSLHLGAEYLLRDFSVPVSLTADLRVTHTGAYSIMGGIKGYFGGNDSGKSLIGRHREDDPWNRALGLSTAAIHLLTKTAPTTPACMPTIGSPTGGYVNIMDNGCFPSDPEQFCIDNGFDSYFGDGECYGFGSA